MEERLEFHKPSNQSLDQPLIVLITNEIWAADALRMALTNNQAQLEIIPRNAESLERAIRLVPTVVAVEISGLGTEGFELLGAFARDETTKEIPCVAMLPLPDPLKRAAAFACNVEDCLSRLNDSDEIRTRILTLAKLGISKMRECVLDKEIVELQTRLKDRSHLQTERERLNAGLIQLGANDKDFLQIRLDGLVRIGLELNKVQDIHLLMDRILSEARKLIGADAGTLYKRENASLRFAYTQNDTLARRGGLGEPPRFSSHMLPVSENSIAGWVSISGEGVNIANAYTIEPSSPFQFDQSFDRSTGYKTQSVLALPLRTSLGRTVGVLQLINAINSDGRSRPRFSETDQALLSHFASMATAAIERNQLHESVIKRMLHMAESHDPIETAQHVERVAGIAGVLFEEWGHRRGLGGVLFERQRDLLRYAARMHDVGKVGVTDSILKKPAKLTAAEFKIAQRHVLIGASYFQDEPTEFDESSLEVLLNHHEKWNGTGYPGYVHCDGSSILDPVTNQPKLGGKRGDEIPVFARIVSVADVFDALSHKRCYKEAWPEQRVLDTMRVESGNHFDPELISIFFEKLPLIRQICDLNKEV